MTDLSRGARVRRGGRRPGWILLTALLVLAIAASSALVFTNRVELLKLAVILALWAAVVAAFVSVIYRRQSDVDQARARDLKLVYDLQLDREISARREYELTVESQLRRELASELRAHAADDIAALRAELAALRTNLEILFNTDFDERPALQAERKALEAERKVVRQYNHWDRENESARERVNRVTSVRAEEPSRRVDDSSIIDVPEEPLAPPPRQRVAEAYPSSHAHRAPEAYEAFPANRAAEAYDVAEDRRGPQWRQGDRGARPPQPDQASPVGGWAPSGVPPSSGGGERPPEQRGRGAPDQVSPVGGWAPPGIPPASGGDQDEPLPPRRSRLQDEAPPQHPEPRSATPVTPPEPQPDLGARPAAGGRPAGWSAPNEARRDSATNWQQVGSEERRLPAGTPGSNWTSDRSNNDGAEARSSDNAPSPDSAPFSSPSFGEPTSVAGSGERRGRHSSAAGPAGSQTGEPETGWREAGRRARARHSAEYADSSVGGPGTSASPPPTPPPPTPPPPTPQPLDRRPVMSAPAPPTPQPLDRPPVMSAPAPPAARHRNTDPSSDADSPPSGGQSVADLLARLQTSPSAGGRRRRRED